MKRYPLIIHTFFMPRGGCMHRILVNVKLLAYLTGFLERRNRRESSRFSREYAKMKRRVRAFTVFALTILRRLREFTSL